MDTSLSRKPYLVSTGDVDETYGLYLTAADGAPYPLLAYFYDHDSFVHIRPGDRARFVPLHALELCKDESGNEYRGEKLAERIQAAIRAYEVELPEFIAAFPSLSKSL